MQGLWKVRRVPCVIKCKHYSQVSMTTAAHMASVSNFRCHGKREHNWWPSLTAGRVESVAWGLSKAWVLYQVLGRKTRHLRSRMAILPQLWLERVHFRSSLSLLSWLRVKGGVSRGVLLAQFLGRLQPEVVKKTDMLSEGCKCPGGTAMLATMAPDHNAIFTFASDHGIS